MLVTLQFVASDTLFNDSRFTVGRPDHLPKIGSPSRSAKEVYKILCAAALAAFRRGSLLAKAGSGGGNHTHLKKFMRLPSVL